MNDKINVVWHEQNVTRSDRERVNGHRGCVVWFTGLSGCGKSTIANLTDQLLFQRGAQSFLLDGDNVRHGLNASAEMLAETHDQGYANRFGLGFGADDRAENIRRIGAVAQLFCSAGFITLAAFVSPYRKGRLAVRRQVDSGGEPGDFIEVYVDTPLEICEQRDPKGLYKKARAGAIKNFTGIDDPYEPPVKPELVLKAGQKKPDELAEQLVQFLVNKGVFDVKSRG